MAIANPNANIGDILTGAVLGGTGFLNGAAVGGISGASSGFVAGVLGTSVTPGADFGDILKGGLSGGFKGGATGAVIGGVLSGIDAASNDRDFWSGKKWITVAGDSNHISPTNGTNISDPDWDFRYTDNTLQRFPQSDDGDCFVGCLKTIDKKFNTPRDWEVYNKLETSLNSNNPPGLGSHRIKPYWGAAGYKTEFLRGSSYIENITNKEGLLFLTKQVMKGRSLGIGFIPYGETTGHASIIKSFKYLSDFSKFKIQLINPGISETTLRSFNRVYQMYGIWKK